MEIKDRVMLSRLRFVMLVCALLLVANLLLGFWVWRLATGFQISANVSCANYAPAGDSSRLQAPVVFGNSGHDGYYAPLISPRLTSSGDAQAEFSFRATTKEPGARYSLRYSVGGAEWREAPAVEIEPLRFRVGVDLPPTARVRYQGIARLAGEVIVASEVRRIDLFDLVGGPDLYYRITRLEDSDEINVAISQAHETVIEAWQVESIAVKAIYRDRSSVVTEMVLADQWEFKLDRLLLDRLEVEAVYSDGLVVEGEIKEGQLVYGDDAAFLTRPRAVDPDPL